MSAKCVVCGQRGPTVRQHLTVGGTVFGVSCDECVGLAWEAYFVRATGGDAHDVALVAWEWRKRRAEAEGKSFNEPPPERGTERGAA